MSAGEENSGRVAGGVLIGAAVLTVAAMLHHPVGHGATGAEMAHAIQRIAGLARAVHGALIALLLALLYAIAVFAQRRGLARPLVLAGFIAFAAGVFTMLLPAVLDGFVLPGLAERAGDDAGFPMLLSFGFSIAIAFAKLASILISLGIVLFSIGLAHERGGARWLGLVGVITVLPAPIAILAGGLDLDVHGMTMVAASWCLWFVGLGATMLRGRI